MNKDELIDVSWRETGRKVLADCSCVLSSAVLTGLCLEFLWPGFMSSRIDLTALAIVAVILTFMARRILLERWGFDRVRTAYIYLFLVADALLLSVFVSLQFESVLLALALPLIVFFSLILVFRSIHDRRGYH